MAILFHGDLGDGSFGTLSAEQIKANLTKKLGFKPTDRAFQSNLTTAMNKVYSGNYTPCADFKSKGDTIYHASSGVGANGCTLFFALRPGASDDVKVAAMVGVGYHVGAQTYAFHKRWGTWDSDPGSKLTLDD